MSEYRKLIAAVVGIAVLLLAKYGVNLAGQEGVLVDAFLAIATAFGVYQVKNETTPPVA